MPNPLILLSEKPVGFLAGRAARHHERWQRDQRVIKAGLTTLLTENYSGVFYGAASGYCDCV